jgi:hypothetical protein
MLDQIKNIFTAVNVLTKWSCMYFSHRYWFWRKLCKIQCSWHGRMWRTDTFFSLNYTVGSLVIMEYSDNCSVILLFSYSYRQHILFWGWCEALVEVMAEVRSTSSRSMVKPLAEVLVKVMSMSRRSMMKPHAEVLAEVIRCSWSSYCDESLWSR